MTVQNKHIWLVAAVAVCVSGCSDNKGFERPTGRGSTSCQAWQKSVCDYVSLDCGALTEAECVDNYYGVTCLSDAQAQSCAEVLDAATCSAPPKGCDLSDIADPGPAIAACENYIATVCQRSVQCGGGSLDTCVAKANSEIDCSAAIAHTVTYESCIKEIQSVACSAQSLPASCEDVIKLSR